MGAPSAILQPGNVDDVACCIRYAKEHQVKAFTCFPLPPARPHKAPPHAQAKLCIAGGRHSHLCMLDDSLVCDFSQWVGVAVDAEAKTAVVQPGALWGHVDSACAPYGLAVTGGHDPSTGVAGLTLRERSLPLES